MLCERQAVHNALAGCLRELLDFPVRKVFSFWIIAAEQLQSSQLARKGRRTPPDLKSLASL